ncbi:4-hydroxy-tetrahydrodipicolinate synthase [Marinoscillum pacificum]|uniref:4-hydroxy-tetrahydrodipicolinate synthase n=1 Tax=Marinoscillum pacificum TaxID=392723 RepID=UPI0021570616|nr:4-hydroxy-tetrahydrodipicolinate synthase [Marinoscillum pacificum]
MSTNQFKGTGVALVTPFKSDLSIDFEALKQLLDHVSEGDVEYLVVLGTTGEAPTVTAKEKNEVIEFVLANNPKNLPVVYGLGGNSTKWTIDQLDLVKDYDLAAILSLSPYYNKPSQMGIQKHYEAIADASPFPVILYNVPARTSSNVTAETTINLSKHPNIIGTKEASGNLAQCMEIQQNTPDDFILISGDDPLTLPMMSFGCVGAISVIANIQPKTFSDMIRYGLAGNFEEANKLHMQMMTGYDLVGKEGNPVSVKTGLEALGLMKRDVRLPLFEGSKELLRHFKMYLGDK